MSSMHTAVAGIGCRFPGASSPEEFWRMLMDGVDGISEVPADRWNAASFYSPGNGSGKTRTKWGGFVEGVDRFDAEFFGISPREAERMDPQQRLLLEVTHEAFEDAGIPLAGLVGTRVGVYVGGFTLDYMLMQLGGTDYRGVEPHTATGSMMTLLANRLSYVYGFNGPSVTVDTACSSSLTAAHLAHQALSNDECDLAVVAGVNALLTPAYTIAESRAGMLSPTGRSRAFDSRADGYVRGEGAGAVVLRRAAEMRESGRRYYAVIRGSAVNQDGRSEGLTVPNGSAQQELLRRALEQAGVRPHQVALIEAHGTGTPVGDPIEANAVGAVLREGRAAGERCFLGSVKTNIGHLEAAAGVAGLIKASLELFHGQVPPHLHLETPNPAIDLDRLQLRIPTSPTALRPEDRFACVNSFGFGGSNAHVVLERPAVRAIPRPRAQDAVPAGATLLPLSVRASAALPQLASAYAGLLAGTSVPPAQVAATAALRRDHHPVRAAVVGTSVEDLVAALAQVDGAGAAPAQEGPLVLVYSGMGPQWPGMGRELYATEPVFRAAVDEIAALGDPVSGWSLVSAFTGELAPERMEETEVAQPANFALQVGLTRLWRSWGVAPDLVVGHSAGEPAAAWAAGVLSLPDAMTVSYARSMTQQLTTGKGRLLAVGEPLDALRARLARHPERRVDLAAVNSPTAITVVGDDGSIAGLAAELSAEEVFCRELAVKVPYHSFYMEEIHDDLLARLAGITPAAGHTPIVSTVTGQLREGAAFDAGYWYANVRQPVRFADAVGTLLGLGARTFLELGPHPVLTRSVLETAEAQGVADVRAASSLRRQAPEREALLRAAGEAYSWGVELDWEALLGAEPAEVALPSYPWQRRRHWAETPDSARRSAARPHPLLWRRIEGAGLEWEADLDAPHLGWLLDHRIEDEIVFPAAGYTELAVWAGRESYGTADGIVFQDLRFRKALYLEPGDQPQVRLTFDPATGEFEVSSARRGTLDWTAHSTGRLSLGRATGLEVPALEPLHAPALGADAVYAQLRGLGLNYGPEFRMIEELRRDGTQAVARVRLSATESAAVDDYVIHPLVIDAAFQVLALAALPGSEGRTFMPVEVAEGRVHGRVPAELVMRAEVRESADGGSIEGDIFAYAPDGTPVLRILGCRAQDVQAAPAATAPMGHYTVEWREAEEELPAPPRPAGRWVLVGEHGFGDALAAALTAAGAAVERWTGTLGTLELRERAAAAADVRGVVGLGALSVGPGAGPDAGVAAGVQAMRLFQAWADGGQAEPPRLWLVTERAQPVMGTVGNALQAVVWGVGRVGGHVELPSLWGGLVDIDGASVPNAELVAAQLLSGDSEDQVGVYAGRRHVPRMVEAPVGRGACAPFRRDGAYLVTGGLGALGLVVAGWMVERGARHVVLVGRQGLPPRSEWPASTDARVRAVMALEAKGASVEVHSCDVADVGALTELRDRRDREGRVPIRGVVHSAGTSIPKLLVSMTDDDFRSIARAKVQGGWALDQVFSTGLDLFVLFSSIASLVVSAGQANYAAGNAYLDALASERHGRGEPATSVNWGPWGDVGMATQLDLVSFFVSRGLHPTTSAQGTAALGQLLASGLAQVAPIAPDWPTAVASYPLGLAPRMLDDLRAAAPTVAEQGGAGSVMGRLDEADEAERPAIVADSVRGLAAGVLRYAAGDLPGGTPLTSLGLDSMIAIELKGRLEKALRVNVPIVSLLKGATLDELVTACQDQIEQRRAAPELDEEIAAVLAAAEGVDIADMVGAATDEH
ncbi:type I polyketide synthase [Motilibacter sp. K478]|nr:type I polyketide synthase [Motilibacter aurantiacus]